MKLQQATTICLCWHYELHNCIILRKCCTLDMSQSPKILFCFKKVNLLICLMFVDILASWAFTHVTTIFPES
jgi:hypothetical protein